MKFDQLIREGRDTDAVRRMARLYYESGKIGHTRMLLLVRIADELDELKAERQDATLRAEAAERAVERLAKAESERVEATSLESYCRDSGCIPYQEGAWMACEACDLCDIPRYYDYLRSNHMIREAEEKANKSELDIF